MSGGGLCPSPFPAPPGATRPWTVVGGGWWNRCTGANGPLRRDPLPPRLKGLNLSWVWRNVVVAVTDAEARREGYPAFEAMQAHRQALRQKIYAEQGIIMKREVAPAARVDPEHALICGAPDTVAARMAEMTPPAWAG